VTEKYDWLTALDSGGDATRSFLPLAQMYERAFFPQFAFITPFSYAHHSSGRNVPSLKPNLSAFINSQNLSCRL
jgi:hypothetical protein